MRRNARRHNDKTNFPSGALNLLRRQHTHTDNDNDSDYNYGRQAMIESEIESNVLYMRCKHNRRERDRRGGGTPPPCAECVCSHTLCTEATTMRPARQVRGAWQDDIHPTNLNTQPKNNHITPGTRRSTPNVPILQPTTTWTSTDTRLFVQASVENV